MARVLLAGGSGLTEIIADLLKNNQHQVTQIVAAEDAVDYVKKRYTLNIAIVESCLSVVSTMSSVACFCDHPAELWVAAACQRQEVPCVIFHENCRSDWHVRMAEEYLNAVVVVRPSSEEDHPDYDQEDRDFARMIVETAQNAFHAKMAVPVG